MPISNLPKTQLFSGLSWAYVRTYIPLKTHSSTTRVIHKSSIAALSLNVPCSNLAIRRDDDAYSGQFADKPMRILRFKTSHHLQLLSNPTFRRMTLISARVDQSTNWLMANWLDVGLWTENRPVIPTTVRQFQFTSVQCTSRSQR